MARSCDKRCPRKNSWFQNISLVLFATLVAGPAYGERELVDRIVADVNGEAVLYSEIQSKLKRGQDVVVTEFPAPASASDFEKSLQDQINFELIMQRAEQLEITVDDKQVEDAIAKFISGQNLTIDTLRESLRRENLTYEEYKSDFRDQMIVRDFQGRVIRPLVKVTDKDIENLYLRKMGATSESVSVKLKQIVLSSSGFKGGAAEAKKKADDAYGQLKSGLSFDEAVNRFSTDEAGKANAGAMPTIKLSDLATELRQKIEPLSSGEYTLPIEMGSNFYIFQLAERSLTSNSEYLTQKTKLENELYTQQMISQTISWLSDQRRRAKPKVIPE